MLVSRSYDVFHSFARFLGTATSSVSRYSESVVSLNVSGFTTSAKERTDRFPLRPRQSHMDSRRVRRRTCSSCWQQRVET